MPKITVPLISSAGIHYTVEFSLQDHWVRYWEQGVDLTPEILQALVKQVINKAYADIDLRTTIQSIVVYHPNHDAGHALRAWVLSAFIASMIQQCGTPEAQEALTQLTHEEWQITLLAAFLYRAGRTNEESSLSGLSQNNRSAQLFQRLH